MKVQTGKALIVGVAALGLALTACSSSGSKTPTNTSSNTSGGAATTPAGGPSSSNSSQGAFQPGTGAFAACTSDPNKCNSGTPKQGGTVTYVLEKTIPGWNVNTSNSGVFELAEVEDGILPSVYSATPDLKPFLNTDLVTSAHQTIKNGKQTLVYNINPKAVWSDGTPINFDDFKYMADVSNPVTCPKCGPASTAGFANMAKLVGSNNGKTVTISMKTPFADWQGLFNNLLPAHIAKQHGGTSGAAGLAASFTWFDKNVPTGFSGGPFMISKYVKDTSVTEVPNPKWYGKVKPTLDSVIFQIITDQTAEVPALQNHEVNAIYPQPNADLVQAANALQGVQTSTGTGLVWEHLDLNEANKFLADKNLRTAIFTAVSQQSIIDRTVGQFDPQIKPLGNHIYLPGQAGYKDNVTSTGQGSGNLDKAKQILTSAGYTGVGSGLKTKSGDAVTLGCMYSAGNTVRQSECQIVQQDLGQLGIKVTLKTSTDLHELSSGEFDMIVFAWQGTPFVVAGAQQIWELKGGDDFGKNNDPAVESLINQAAQSTDPAKVQQLMDQADVKLTADAYVLPLYPKPSFLAADTTVINLRNNATSVGPPYNVQEWGLHS